MLYCAISMATPAGRVTPLLRRMSLTTRRLREFAATGCSLMLSCRFHSSNVSGLCLISSLMLSLVRLRLKALNQHLENVLKHSQNCSDRYDLPVREGATTRRQPMLMACKMWNTRACGRQRDTELQSCKDLPQDLSLARWWLL